MGNRVRAVVAGATGYSGRELIRLIAGHRGMELAGVFASRGGSSTPIVEIHPQLRGFQPGGADLSDLDSTICHPFDEEALARLMPEVIFLATPNEFSHEIMPSMLATGATVVDLSGSFRLRDASLYPAFYGFEHQATPLLEEAVYGMTELVRAQLPGADGRPLWLYRVPGSLPGSMAAAACR